MSDVPAGWQPDPENPGGLRYWDGSQWTEHRQAAPAPAPPPAPAPAYGAPPPYGAAPGYGQPGTPFVPTGAPVSNNSGCLKWGLIALGVVVVFTIIGAGCLVFVGKNAVDSLAKTFGEAKTSDYSAAITSCTSNGSSSVSVNGTIKNKRSRRQAYRIEVRVTADNAVVGVGTAYPGQLASEETQPFSTSVFGTVPEGVTPVCQISEVDYTI